MASGTYCPGSLPSRIWNWPDDGPSDTHQERTGSPGVVSRRETPGWGFNPQKAPGRDALALRLTRRDERQIRYALYRSYVLFVNSQIEPISEHIHDQFPLGKAQRLDRQADESPALPLSYSAVVIKLIERGRGRQPPRIQLITIQQHITVEQHIPFGAW
jgi:hypothetical protein